MSEKTSGGGIGGFIGTITIVGILWLGARATVFPQTAVKDETVRVNATQSYQYCYKPNFANRKLVADIAVSGGAVEGAFVKKSSANTIMTSRELQLAALGSSYSPSKIAGKIAASTQGGEEACLMLNPKPDPGASSVSVTVTIKSYYRF